MLECRHELRPSGALTVVACDTCGMVQFWDEDGPVDPANGMAELFGAFTMQQTLPTLGGPGPRAILYRAPTETARRYLDAFPSRVWLETQPGLWMSHDGTHLLLSPSDPLVAGNLGKGA